jgi:hypothetical protein
MALTLKQTGTGKTWTSGSRKQEENKQTTGANTAPAAAPSAAPARRTQTWQAGGLTLKRENAELPTVPQVTAEKPAEKRGFFSRLGDTIRGGAKGSLASNSNAMSTFYAMGQGGRDAQNREYLAEYSHNLERAKLDMDAMLAENKEKPGSWNERDIQSQQYIIDDWQRKYDAMVKVLDEQVQQKATQASYELADDIQQSSAQDIERAKEGLGGVGRVLVDAGASMTQTALDTASNALLGTPGSMGAFAMRAFGGGTQQARQDNPNSTLEQQVLYGTASAAKEVFTEKMFNIALPFSHAYGGGALDDAVERGIRSAVNRFAKTDAGKRVLGGALTFGAGAVGEGLEEFIGDWMEWQMPRIYGGDAASAGETLENSLYDFLVGAASGMMGGVITPATYHYNVGETGAQQETTAPTPQTEATPQATAANELLTQAAEQASQNGSIHGKMADRILADQDAMAALEQAAGQVVQDGMTKSQQRKAVKNAVETLARTQSDVSANTRETVPAATEARQAATQETVRPAMQVEQHRPAAQQAYDIRRVRDAAASLGENGAKALSASYDGSVRADDYYAGFASYYEAGISGIDMDKVQSRYAAQLNQAQRFAAYSAGQNDAAASLALEREGVKSATVYGDEAGFVQSEHSASLPKETVRFYDSLARAAGVKIQMAEATGKGGANGWYSNGIIHIANDAENPGTVVAKHEITHRMQEMAPEAYRKYRDYAMSALTERDGSTASIVEQYKSRYAEAGVNLSTEQAMDEIAADFTEALTVDPARFETLAKENRSVARKLLDAVRDFIRKVKSLFKGNKTAQNQAAANAYGVSIDTLEEAARLWEEALKATSEQTANKNAAQTDGGTKFSIKRTSQMTLAQQLKMFYDGKMASSDAFYFGVTPAVLEKSGFDALPLTMTIGDFRKSTQKKHNIPRRVLKNLMSNLASPLFSFGSGDRAGIVLNDIDGDGYTLLAALERGTDMDRKPVNVINSLYGLEHPAEWIKNQIDSGNEFVLYDEKRANAFLQTYGYMASVGDGIRSTGESVTQNGAEVKTKFSLKTPVEETDKLLALHNKDENSILAAIKLGGLPMPSIAIVKARDGHTKYGPISLVFSKDTIDPQLFRANKVYGGDAWTPTAPRVDYPVNSKKASQVEHELHRLAGDVSVAGGIFGNSAALRSVGIDDTSTRSTAELAERLASTDTVRAAYLADQGKSLEPVKMDKVWDKFGNDTLQKVVDRLGVNTLAEIEANLETGESVKDALGENAEVIRDILRDYYREQGEPMLRRMAVKRHWTDAEINERRQTRIDNSMDGVSIFTLEDIVHHAWDMYQDGGATKGEIDRMATSDALRSAVDDHAVEEWIAGKLDGLLGEAGIYNGKDPYTPSGNLRSFSQLHYAYTLENIVKAMKEGQEERGGNTWGASAKTLQSVATPEYRSIQEIKADSGRLGMDEGAEYEAKLQAIDDQIGSIITKIKQGNKAHSDNSFVESDIIGSILMETSKGKRTVDAIMRAFSKEGYKISSQTAQDIQAVYQEAAEMPTGYFEAKPQRAVGFDEVLAAVIPDDSSKKLRDGLEQAGVRMLEYKTGDDADRLAKINSVEGARFSLKGRDILQENAALQEENRLLREQMKDYIAIQRRNGKLQESRDYWQGQTRRTQRVTTDKKAVTAAAKQLIQNYGADIAVKDIQGDLQSLYDYIASGYDGKDELTYTEARRRAEDIAQTLVSNAVAVDSDMYDAYSDLRDYLRTTKIIYGKEYHGDIADYGDFRKRQFGRLNLGSEGHTNIDQVYQELSSRWPEFFSEQEQTHPTDQLLHIVEVLDGISEINEYNPFSRYMDQAVTGAANEIMETFFDLPQTRKTFADQQALKLENAKAKGREQVQKVQEQYATRLAEQKARSEERLDQAILGEKMAGGRELAKQKRLDAERMQKVREQNAARLAELREQNRQRVQNAIAKERETRERQMGALKDRYAAKDAAGRERRAARELRAKIIRHASALSQKLLRPSDQHHIPEAMRGSVAAMLESINQESQYTLDENGKRVKDGSGTPTKRTEAFRALKEQYAKIVAEGGDMVIDPSLLGSDADGIKGGFDAVIAMKDTKLADMSVAQLQTVWQVVKAVEHSVNTAGKVLSKAKYARTADWAQALSIGTSSRRAKNSLTRNHALIDLETPYTFFSHYGEAGKAVYRMLRDAQDQQQLMVDHVAEEVRKIVDPKTVKKLEATTHTFTTERGEELTLSTAQVMELYELVKRKQAHDHLLKGGVVQPEIKTSQIRRGTDSIRLTEGDLANITGTLTPEQVKIADGLQGLTRGVLADYGNKASMEAYGYKKFTESDYWPIKSAKEGLHSNIEKGGNNTRSIKNIGMAKTTMPHASNALDLAGIFTTFANHASDMTDYASWLCTMEDINRLFNYQFRDEEGNPTGKTIKGLLDRVGGPGSQKYWHNLMEDIQNGINAPGDSPMWDIAGKTIGGFKGAAVGANIRVVIQQPTAFFRAAAVLDPQDMARGLARGVTRGSGWKKALQYSPIAMRKDAGGFDISSPYKMTETLFDNRTNVRKLNDALSAPAGAADAVTWGKLWNACEWATAREHQGLTKGSEAFYRQTAKLFAEVIDQTQVVDGVLQRSNIMRSSNAVVKQATSFMGEPIMSLNLLMRAYDQVRYEQNSQKRGKAIKTMGRAATALVVTNVVNALAQSLIDAMRDDDEDKKYWERFRAAFTGISGDEETPWEKAWNAITEGNVGSNMNPLGQIPFVKDALSIMQGYDVSRTEMEIVSDLIQAGQTAIQSADGQGKRTRAYALKGLLAAGAKMFGIPASNLTRDMWGLARSAAVETGNVPLQYEMEKAIYNISNTGNKTRYYAILYRALEQGDMDTYQHIRDDLMNSMGVDGASIDSAMRSRYNKAVEKDPDYTLPQRARDLIGSRDKYAPAKEKEETFGADDLGSSAYRAYSDQRASDYRSMADDLTSSPIFQGMDDETRDKVLKAAYDLADKSALADHSDGQYEVSTKWMAQADDAEAQGIEPWEYVLFHTAYNEMEGTKDADGKTVKGEAKSDHVREWLEDFSGLTDEQRAFLWGTVYTSQW